MGSDDWYRNRRWDSETERAFDARLARSRSQKAQYLRIQGSILKETHPEAAIGLLRRCIDEGDSFHVAHAHLDTAHAHYVLGDVDSALASLEAAIDQEEREPMFRTSAPFDFAFLAALHGRTERYGKALALLDRQEGLALFASMRFEAEAARALIHAETGRTDEARVAAVRALDAEAERTGWIPGHPDVGIVPEGDTPLGRRLREISSAPISPAPPADR